MNERLKALAEIASIELAYARAEVEMAERIGEVKERIAKHLDAVSDALELIMSGVDEYEICERIVAQKETCPALSDKSGEPFWKI
jgi:phage host-nuclease inhibitor protein Gam